MIELIVQHYLVDALGLPVLMETPEKRPDRYVLVEKVGGSESNFINSATLAIQSIAPSLYEAAALNEEVKRAMGGIVWLDAVSRCVLNSDYNYTNTATKQYRYQAVFDLTY